MKCAVLVLLIASAYASPVQDKVNSEVDEILKNLNAYIYENAYDEMLIPDVAYEAAPVFIGSTISNMSTIVRKGNSELKFENGEQKLKMLLGLKDMKIHVAVAPFTGNNPLTWYMSDTVVEVGVTLHTKETVSDRLAMDCKSTWDYIKIVNMGNIFSRTANKVYNNQPPPKELLDVVLPFYAEQLNGDSYLSIKNLDNVIDLCKFKN